MIHLHTHSYYSLLRGVSSPAELAKAAAENDLSALAMTDTRCLSGAIEFFDACQQQGIQPILGLEIKLSYPRELFNNYILSNKGIHDEYGEPDAGRIVLLAMDDHGWSSLCRISSRLQIDIDRPLDFDFLANNNRGLICLTGGKAGFAYNLILNRQNQAFQFSLSHLKEIFPDRIYIETQVQTIDSNSDSYWRDLLVSISSKLQIPLIVTKDIYYLQREETQLQRVLTAIRLNLPIKELPDSQLLPPGLHFPTRSEMTTLINSQIGIPLSTVIENARDVARRCNLCLPLGKPHYPQIDVPEGQSLNQILRQKAYHGAINKYGTISQQIQSRLEHELNTIDQCGYASLFLIMEEIVQFARRKGVPISSRGSAASSLVAYCLGITSPDPISLNLYFERFLNPARATPPDFDIDLCSRKRDDVIQFVYQRYGHDKVAMISTINRFRSRSALREAAKAFGLTAKQVNTLGEKLPYRWHGSHTNTGYRESSYADLEQLFPGDLYQTIFKTAQEMIGLPHHLSIHPGGIVITPGLMTDILPTQLATKGITITQFDHHSIERFGLLKIDLLGIRGLSVLGDVVETIYKDREGSYSTPIDILDTIPDSDPTTSDLIRSSRTIGCFQIESPGMRTTLKEIRASNIDDIMVALALYRPGPLSGGLKTAFVERFRSHIQRRQQNEIDDQAQDLQLHPSLKSILRETYGVILYQEQVLRIAHELAGFNLDEADLLRRAMSHFDPGKQMNSLKVKFITGAMSRKNVPETVAERIWELMAAFAGYGFPKAHAASYAQIAWRSAWCKAHFPEIFMTAVLANWGGYYSQRVYLSESRRLGLEVKPPHINFSQPEFSLVYINNIPTLFMGLSQVRDLTHRVQSRILQERPFQSLDDFLLRVDPRPIEAKNLILAGALEGLSSTKLMLRRIQAYHWQGSQLPLFPTEDLDLNRTGDTEDNWTLPEKVAAQEAVLGVSISAHPLELVTNQVKSAGTITTLEATDQVGKKIKLAGIRQTWHRVYEHGEAGYIMSLEDLEGIMDIIIPVDVYQRYRNELRQLGPFIIEGTIMQNPFTNDAEMRATNIWYINR